MTLNEKYKRRGLAGTLIFHLLLLAALFFVALRTPLPLPGEEGVEVSLGDVRSGSGNQQDQGVIQEKNESFEESKVNQEDEVIHQEVEEAPAMDREITKIKPEIDHPDEEVAEEKVIEEPKINPKALYSPKNTGINSATGNGTGINDGNEGKPDGSETGLNSDGSSGNGDGISYNLNGRKPMYLPKPDYNSMEQGKVVVTIWVDQHGKVTRAIEGAKGTTISDLRLQSLARDAALNATFNPDPNAASLQKGSITYNFIRLN